MSNVETEKQKLVLETLFKHLRGNALNANGSNQGCKCLCQQPVIRGFVLYVPIVIH